jgi:hypothetical protein
MTLHLNSSEDIADVFLGLKKVPISNFSTFQSRFGIKLPLQSATDGLVSIQPNPADECSIIVKRNALAIPAAFNADLFLPAIPLPRDKKKFLLVNPLFTMTVEFNGKITAFTVTYKIERQNMPVEVWTDFWRMILAFSAGQGTIEVRPKNMPAEMRLEITQPNGPPVEYCEFIIDLCERVSDLFKRVGLLLAPKLSLQEMESSAKEIVLVSALIKGESPSISLKLTRTSELEKVASERFVFAKVLVLGDVAIAYYGTIRFSARVEGDEILWDSTEFSPGTIKVIRNLHEDFDAFIKKASEIEKTTNVMRFEAESVDTASIASPFR